MAEQQSIFMVHASDHKLRISGFDQRMIVKGSSSWLGPVDLMPGQCRRVVMSNAIRSVGVLLPCLARHVVEKGAYVQLAFLHALSLNAGAPRGKRGIAR